MANRQDPSNARQTRHSVPIALQREATRATAGIRVTSPQIDRDAPIPERHTEYGEGRSPALQWKPVGGARSYAVLVEDPDAPGAEPFVHWLAWNIPPDLHELPEDIRADTKPQAP